MSDGEWWAWSRWKADIIQHSSKDLYCLLALKENNIITRIKRVFLFKVSSRLMPAFSWNELQKRLKNNQQCEVTLEKTLSLWACIISAAGVGAYGTPEVHGIIPVWFTGQNEVDSQKGNNSLLMD